MDSRIRQAAAGWAGAGLALLAAAATAPGSPASAAALRATSPDTATAQLAPARLQPGARVGGARHVDPAASAASGAADDGEVQTTVEDGRRVTRNAPAPKAARVGSSPNN
jgi:hypothetical protein